MSKITTWPGLEEEGSRVQPGSEEPELLQGEGNHEPGEGQGGKSAYLQEAPVGVAGRKVCPGVTEP